MTQQTANRSRWRERGFAVVENLVAVMLITVSVAGATGIFRTSIIANGASRIHASEMADILGLIDGYRQLSFATLLLKFGGNPTNGQQVTETISSNTSRATYTITFTALRTAASSEPEAVRVRIDAIARRGKLEEGTALFETLIARIR